MASDGTGPRRRGVLTLADRDHRRVVAIPRATWSGARVLLLVVALLFAASILWAVSVGALRELRRARRLDPRDGCQAWVEVRSLPGRRYRCGRPLYAGGPWCRRHEVMPRERGLPDADVELLDEPQAVGRALAQARVGVPVAIAAAVALLATLAWMIQRLS